MCTLIALHHGRKTKSESFASCRGRVNISGDRVNKRGVWWDSLSVAVPSKFNKSFRACATPVIPP